MQWFVLGSSFSGQERRTDRLDLDSVLVWDLQYSLFRKLITQFLHYPFEAVIIASYVDLSSFRSLLCGPVQVTFVLSEISVISVR